jgi:GNAT superfamily N-acetyltransferase
VTIGTRVTKPKCLLPLRCRHRTTWLLRDGWIVHPEYRRRGIAAALTEARLDWISDQADKAWYFANARNAASIALHASFAFEEVTRSFSYPREALGRSLAFWERKGCLPYAERVRDRIDSLGPAHV